MAPSWDPCGENSGDGTMAARVALFRSLGDTTRLAILQRLARGEARVTDLVATLGLTRFVVSEHLSRLLDCGFVDVRAAENGSFYSLAQPELMDLLHNAGQLLAAVGPDLVFSPDLGTTGESMR